MAISKLDDIMDPFLCLCHSALLICPTVMLSKVAISSSESGLKEEHMNLAAANLYPFDCEDGKTCI